MDWRRETSSGRAGSLSERLRAMPARAGRALLIEYIGATVQDLLGAGRQAPPRPDQVIMTLGLPSLRLIELKDRLEQALSVEAPVALFFEQVTVDGLAGHLLSKLARSASDERSGAAAAGGARREEEILAMSEEEAEADLLRRVRGLSPSSKP